MAPSNDASSIFRKKSLERVASPDQLDQYIRVSSPAAWLVLSAILLLLVAAIVWACLGRVPTTRHVSLDVENGQVSGRIEGVPDGSYEADVTVSKQSPVTLFLDQ